MMVTLMLLALQVPVIVTPQGTFRTIAAAVAAAPDGGTVRVPAGVWREPTIRLTRPVRLVGDPGAVLDGEGQRGLVVIAAADVTVEGLTFRNTGYSYREDRAALLAEEAVHCVIADNRFEETFFAIYLSKTEGCLVRQNRVSGTPTTESATGNAVHSWGSTNLRVEGNHLQGHRDGIYLEFSRHTTVVDNLSEHNLRYGLHFMYSDSSSYTDNAFQQNGSGVAVMFSRAVTMIGNQFVGNRGPTAYGLLLKDMLDVRLTENLFLNNTTGLLADGAERVQVLRNRFVQNGWAIRLLGSTSDGRFVDNDFSANSFDVAVNSRSVQAEFTGNWWDSYRGWDLDHDGTGDVPHHPLRLFGTLVERAPAALTLQHSLFVRALDAAERVLPVLTPKQVVDHAPRMTRVAGGTP